MPRKPLPAPLSDPDQEVPPEDESPSPQVPPEPSYLVTLEFQSAAWMGDLRYHEKMTKQAIQDLLDGATKFVRVTQVNPLPGSLSNEVHFVSVQQIQEVIIAGWPI